MSDHLGQDTSARKRQRHYGDDQLAIFARCKPNREDERPVACTGGAVCWVEQGPPAISPHVRKCIGCGGAPNHLTERPGVYNKPRDRRSLDSLSRAAYRQIKLPVFAVGKPAR